MSPLRRRSSSLILASLLFPPPNMPADVSMPVCCSDKSMVAIYFCCFRQPMTDCSLRCHFCMYNVQPQGTLLRPTSNHTTNGIR